MPIVTQNKLSHEKIHLLTYKIKSMEKFIQLPNGANAFITGVPDDSGCEHKWDGDGLVSFGNSDVTMSDVEYKAMYERMSEQEWQEWHKDKGSIMGECTCSKCGVPYTVINNPYYL
jgi:hypothetical protein